MEMSRIATPGSTERSQIPQIAPKWLGESAEGRLGVQKKCFAMVRALLRTNASPVSHRCKPLSHQCKRNLGRESSRVKKYLEDLSVLQEPQNGNCMISALVPEKKAIHLHCTIFGVQSPASLPHCMATDNA